MIKGFSHTQLIVSDLDASIAWYGVVLGMELMSRGPYDDGEYAALRSVNGRFVIGLQNVGGDHLTDERAGMIHHLSFAVEDRADLERHHDAIVAAGIAASELIEEAASYNFRFRDPDGLPIELTASKS